MRKSPGVRPAGAPSNGSANAPVFSRYPRSAKRPILGQNAHGLHAAVFSRRLLFCGVSLRTDRSWQGLRLAAALCALCAGLSGALAQDGAEPGRLTPDQQAIIDKIAKPSGLDGARYAGPTDPIGAQVTLPLGDGQFVTLVQIGSVLQKDGSVVWQGQVQQTGERATLML